MKRFRSNILGQVFCFIAIALFVLPVNVASVLARELVKATTEIKYEPIEYFVPEKRIKLEAEMTDEEGINLVRCYFRAAEQANYVFVAMKPGSSLYQGILPAPSKETETIEYLFLVVNGKNHVVKTQTFKVNKKDDEDEAPAWQQVSSKGDIQVSTELAQAPQSPVGFTDSIAMDVAESSARFGFVVGGIYTATQAAEAGGTSGTAAGASSAGTVSAKTGGLSTLAYVGIGVGAAAVTGGVIAAASGGGGGGHHDDRGGPVDVTEATAQDFVGTFQGTDPSRTYSQWHSTYVLNENGTGTFDDVVEGESRPGTITWNFNPNTDVFTYTSSGGATFSGTVSGTTDHFTISGSWSGGEPGTQIWVRQ